MNYGGISLEAYQDRGNGFGDTTMSDVAELNKALEATELKGGATDGLTTASGAPLKVESLEKTLKVVTFTQKNIVFWKETPVLPAYNTVEEFNKLTSYGSDQGGFTDEGELPQDDDSVYVRESALVKYLGNTRVITHPMTLVNTAHGAVMQREINNGTMWILSKIERALFEGNANIIPQEFNGIYVQMMADFANEISYLNSDNVVDMRGMRIDEDALELASNTIIENYGYATDIYWSPKAGSDFSKNFYPRQRTNTPVQEGNKVGSNITDFVSQAGTIKLHPDVFLRPKPSKTDTTLANSTKAPNVPIADGTTPIAPVAPTVVSTKFGSSDNGNYLYAVSALNRYGESALTLLTQNPCAVAVGGCAALKFAAGGGQYAATGFRIYRTNKGDTFSTGVTNYYPLFDISAAQLANGVNGGAASIVWDLNLYLPNTTKALMLQKDLEFYSFKQLAPLMKMDLALLSPSYRFMILLYGTPVVYAPRKAVEIINIGSTANATTNALIA